MHVLLIAVSNRKRFQEAGGLISGPVGLSVSSVVINVSMVVRLKGQPVVLRSQEVERLSLAGVS